jgi:hypothetical protein
MRPCGSQPQTQVLIVLQELYQKTEYDAAVRYNRLLKKLEIGLDSSSAERFLHIVKIPAFCERLKWIRFCDIEDELDDDHPPGFGEEFDFEGTGNWTRIAPVESPICPEYEFLSDSGEAPNTGESGQFASASLVRASKLSGLERALASDEVVHNLTKCFQHLKVAKDLKVIKLYGAHGHDEVLRGMSLASFPRKVVDLAIDVARLTRVGYGSVSDRPQDYVQYVRGLQIDPSDAPDPGPATWVDKYQGCNPFGVHIKNFRPTTTTLTKLVSAFVSIENLTIYGCRMYRNIRFCHGCDDLFAKSFAPAYFPYLSNLNLNHILISGGRLRRFVKRHSATLFRVEMVRVMLTDGSWRSIFQGLAKLSKLKNLKLHNLRQKHREQSGMPPEGCRVVSHILTGSERHVQVFLNSAVEFFSTFQGINPDRFRKSPPIYHQVKLFEPLPVEGDWL